MSKFKALKAFVNSERGTASRSTFTEVHAQTGQSRIERYGWKVCDAPGIFMQLDKDILGIDDEYQRDEKRQRIREIAAAWSWAACGAISVARRGDFHYVFDGQQRTLAARLRADIKTLPCMVFQSTGVEQEASAFLQANTHRKPVTAVEKFKAMLVSGDPIARRVHDLIEGSGYTVRNDSTGRSVRCVRTLVDVARVYPDLLGRMWPLIVEVAAGGTIQERVLVSLVHIESNLEKEGDGTSLLKAPWRGRVIKLGTAGIIEAAGKAAAFYAHGGTKVWASGVVNALNKGLRNPLPCGDAPRGDACPETS